MPKKKTKTGIKMTINRERLERHAKTVCAKNLARNAKICEKCPFAEIIRRKFVRGKRR